MKGRRFALIPFAPLPPGLDLRISGHIARCGHVLSLSFDLRGRLSAVALPAPVAVPARRYDLWEETCFEFFLGVEAAAGYWEFNLSPAGDWNVYHFAGYRQGMAEAAAFSALPFSVRSGPDSWHLSLEVDLARLVRADQTLEVGIAAVVKLRDGLVSYWALTHPGAEPDFHRRDSFLVKS
jgi:hypothetical protein